MTKKKKAVRQAPALPFVTAHTPSGAESPGEFTAEELRGILTNPIYAGLGPYPQIIADEVYIAAAARLIREQGPEQFLVNLLAVLREALGSPFDRGAEPPAAAGTH
jgi:hypothetical protein